MYRLGFCVYGAHCRYKHSWAEGPPPSPKIAAIKLAELHRHRARRHAHQLTHHLNPTCQGSAEPWKCQKSTLYGL